MKLLPLLGLTILLFSCSNDENVVKDMRSDEEIAEQETQDEQAVDATEIGDPTEKQTERVTNSDSEWTYDVTFISEGNWGYQLFQKGEMVINQTSIPSIQGTNGFDSEEKAERTARFILHKLENGIFPPTVDKEELDSLDVLRD